MSRRARTDDNTEQSFLRRWSRRKAQSERAGDTADRPTPPELKPVEESGASAAEVSTRAEEAVEPVKMDEDMPDLESIDENTDMSDFFSPGVSEKLRNQALRQLFRTAKFNVVDPLDDYNQDFRNFEALGDLVTSDMRHRTEMDEQRAREAAETADSAPDGEPAADEPVEDTGRQDREPARTAAEGGREDGSAEADPDSDEADIDSDAPSRTRA